MKRSALTLLIFLCASTAMASGYWMVPYGDGTWRAVNGAGANDGWVWERYSTCGCKYKCRCSKWGYRKLRQLIVAPVLEYKKGWQESAMNATYQIIDNQYFLAAQRQLAALSPNGYQQGHGQQYASSTIQRGVTAVYPLSDRYDPNYIAHAAERTTLRLADISGQNVAGMQALAHAQIEASKAQAIVQIASQGLQPVPTTETYQYQQQSGEASASGSYGVGVNPDSMFAVRSLAGASAIRSCVTCHSGPTAKGDLDLSAITSYSTEDRELIANEALDRMVGPKSQDPSTRMPPKGEAMSANLAVAITDHIRGKPADPVQRQYRPQVQPQVEQPQNDEPPPEPMP